jgi:hypothetical protein
MSRIALLVALLLAGCTAVARPVSAPIPTPTKPPAVLVSGLPTAMDVVGWVFIIKEIEYIRLFRVGFSRWTPAATKGLSEIVTQYRHDPAVLRSNAWRVQAADTAEQIGNARLWFGVESPSTRFRPLTNKMAETLTVFRAAADTLKDAIDESDARGLEAALEQTRAGVENLKAIGALFTVLVGPPD